VPAGSHAAAISRTPGLVLKSCLDTDLEAARELAAKYGVENTFSSLEELDQACHHDLIVIAAPDNNHYRIAHHVLENPAVNPQAIFIEKPVCQTQQELATLQESSDRRGILLMVNMSRRFHPLYRDLQQCISMGKTGRLTRADILYYGGWRHNGIHVVDTLHYLFGKDLLSLEVVENNEAGKDDPSYTVRCHLDGLDAVVWIHGLSDANYQLFDLDFKFTQGRLQIRNFESDISWETVEVNEKGESVLVPSKLFASEPNTSAFETAYTEILGYLDTGEAASLPKATISDISSSMKALWSVND
jgi:predicted dehydrogenase